MTNARVRTAPFAPAACVPMGRWVFVAALLLSVVLGYGSTSACTCEPSDPVDEFEISDTVFAGTVVAAHEPQRTLRFQPSFPFVAFVADAQGAMRITFRVARVWKGAPPTSTIVLMIRGPVTEQCSIALEQGADYLVYAIGSGNEVEARECGRLVTLAGAADDLVAIGGGNPPMRVHANNLPQPFPMHLTLLVGTLLVVAGVLLVRNRRRRRSSSRY